MTDVSYQDPPELHDDNHIAGRIVWSHLKSERDKSIKALLFCRHHEFSPKALRHCVNYQSA